MDPNYKYKFPKEGEDGFNPNFINLKPPKEQMIFPIYKGKRIGAPPEPKDQQEPENKPVQQQEQKILIKEQKFTEIAHILNDIPQLIENYINENEKSIRNISNDNNLNNLTKFSISITYLSLANQILTKNYHRTDSLKELSILKKFSPTLPDQLHKLLYQHRNIYTLFGNIETKWIKTTIEQCIIKSAQWLTQFLAEELPSVEEQVQISQDQPNQISQHGHQVYQTKGLKQFNSQDSTPKEPDKHLTQFFELQCQEDLLILNEKEKNIYIQGRLIQQQKIRIQTYKNSLEQQNQTLPDQIPQIQYLQQARKAKSVLKHSELIQQLIIKLMNMRNEQDNQTEIKQVPQEIEYIPITSQQIHDFDFD